MQDLTHDIATIRRTGESFGLRFLDVHFQSASRDALSELASFGLPNRFSHWYFGGIYKRLKTQQDENMFQILELVLNTDPSYAFLLETNSYLENRMVIAHVFGHVDFFKNNRWYKQSDKGILDTCERNARTIRRMEPVVGKDLLDDIIASALTISSTVDPFELDPNSQRKKLLYFLSENAPIALRALPRSDPRRKVLSVAARILPRMRAEMDYFDLIGRTQIINEGWASFVERSILRHVLTPAEWLDFSLAFSKRPAHYLIGCALFEKAFEQGGWDKILMIRSHYEDIAFVDEYLSDDLCRELDLFVQTKDSTKRNHSARAVKDRIIYEKLFKGQPLVEVEDYERSTRAIALRNIEEGRRLDRRRTELFLQSLYRLWPFDLSLIDGDVTYRYGAAGFSHERSS